MSQPIFAVHSNRIRPAQRFLRAGRPWLGAALVLLLAGGPACRAPSAAAVERALLALPRQEPARERALERVGITTDLGHGRREEELVLLRAGPTSGRAPRATFVLVHGTPGSALTWTPVIFGAPGRPGLADEHEVLALEVVGHGFAAARGAPYSFQRCADFVGDALEALGLEDVILVGHSYGGEFAWRAALDRPERVRALVLVDSAGFARPADGWLSEERAMRELPFAELGWILSTPERVRSALEPHFAAGVPPGLDEELFHACARPDAWRAMVELARDEEGRRAHELCRIEAPVLLLWGSRDLAYPVAAFAERFEQALPHATLRVFEGAGHYPHEERPADFVRALADFAAALERAEAGGAGGGALVREAAALGEAEALARPAEGEPTAPAARALAWSELAAEGHDPRSFLPEELGEGDFLPFARRLAALRLPLALEKGGDVRERGLGELLAATGRDPRSLERVLAALARSPAPEAKAFAALLDRRRLLSERWNPDQGGKGDGFLFGPVLDRGRFGLPWSEAKGSPDLLQALVLARCDEHAWLDGQGDFARYLEDVGARYEEVRPRPSSRVRGVDPDGRGFEALFVDVRADLPFPFGGFRMPLGIVCRLDERGDLVTDVHATCDDFLWLRGQDRVLPLADERGEPAGLLVLRRYGFDLAGVPDGRAQREAALRSSLGNLVLRAERSWRESGPRVRGERGELPAFRVSGAR